MQVYSNPNVIHLFRLAISILHLLIHKVGLDFDNQTVEEIYYYFLYLLKPFLILKQYLNQNHNQTQPPFPSHLQLSKLKTIQDLNHTTTDQELLKHHDSMDYD